jgi:predicted phage terminase large subunit-like protein
MKLLQNSQGRKAIHRARLEDDLHAFSRESWKILEPATNFLDNWHIALICDYLTLISRGQLKRLIINIPRRYMKSSLVSVNWPVWEWPQLPSQKWMFASYSHDLSVKHSIKRRRILESAWYKDNWGHVIQMSADQNQRDYYENTFAGSMLATSMTGTALGLGGNRLIIDDPVDPEEARSKLKRETANREFDQKFYGSLDDKINGAIVLIMQRLNEEDLTGHISGIKSADLNSYLIESGGWTMLRIPAEAEITEEIRFPLHPELNFERKKGDLLWPLREGPPQIELIKATLRWGYAGQYQQRPTAEEGGIFKRKWITENYYTEEPRALCKKLDTIIQSWDTSFKDLDTSDYVVGTVWGMKGADIYLLDWIRDKLDLPGTIQAIYDLSKAWPKARLKLIEDTANGPAVIQVLKKKIQGLVPVGTKGESKESRAVAVTPLYEAGNIHYPALSLRPTVKNLIDEVCDFPNAANDDFVDSMSQGLNRLGNARARKKFVVPDVAAFAINS